MIVNRRVWGIRSGCAWDAVTVLRREYAAESERGGYVGPVRIYVSETAELDQIAIEEEHANLAVWKKRWTEWLNRPTTPAFASEWHELRTRPETNENWSIPV